ncbi:alpha-Mannosidase class I b [Arctopsyche grandis]|uniref:alpha-Mannosidase class I b n=1 Tax=Arctopsyche grandis TaxID=121162 RepID=UPI00406D7AEA
MFRNRSSSNSLYLSLSAEDSPGRRSLWRWWNQLSRLQRSLIYIIILIICITIIYFIPNTTISSSDSFLVKEIPNNAETANVQLLKDESIVESNTVTGQLQNPELANQLHVGVVNPPFQQQQIDEPQYLQNKVQFNGPTNDKQQAVVEAFQHAWKGYKKFAWGHDHLRPITGGYQEWFSLGLTLIDGLDTAYIMGLTEEYKEAKDWVATKLSFDVNKDVNLFEVTIRVLGALLSNYHLTGDSMFLDKAVDLGERLLPAFETPSGIPYSDVNLATRRAHSPKWSPDSSTSEVTTIQLEFRDLSRVSQDSRFEQAASKVSQHVHGLEKTHGLVPIFINPSSGQFLMYSTITLGARGDSYYEYLLKQWIQTGKTIDYLRDDYKLAIEGIQELLVKKTSPNKLVFLGELVSSGKNQRELKPKMDHLTCYLPGTLALGVKNGMPEWHMKLAEDLMNTCYQTYAIQPTFLAPEITYFNMQSDGESDMYVKSNDAHNLLRPEYLESLWYLYQFTGNTTYQKWGWQIFQAFEKYTKVQNGYTSIGSVKNPDNTRPRDMMESFFLGETLKYCYLLFSDDRHLLDLSKYVINSEAHPLPIRDE